MNPRYELRQLRFRNTSQSGEAWYQSRIQDGHEEWTYIAGRELPTIEEHPNDIPIQDLADQLTYDLDIDEIESTIRRSQLRHGLLTLPSRERQIIELRWGIHPTDDNHRVESVPLNAPRGIST